MKFRPYTWIPYLLIVAGIVSIAWWITKDPARDLAISVPGMDNRGKGVADNFVANIGEYFKRFDRKSTDLK